MPRTFTITQVHLDAFSKQQEQRFEDEMLVHLRARYPAEARKLGDARLRELIRNGMATARSYGIVRELDVARYIELMIAISPDFDRSKRTPWAKPILTDGRLSGGKKIAAIYQHLTFGGAEQPNGRTVK